MVEELRFLLENLYEKYGLTDEVINLSRIIDRIIVEDQKKILNKYKEENKYKRKYIFDNNFKIN